MPGIKSVSLLLVFLSFSTFLHAYDNSLLLDTDIFFSNGYRRDRVSTFLAICDFKEPSIITQRLKVKNIQLYQFGIKAKWALFQYFLRLEVDLGWSHRGEFREVTKFQKISLPFKGTLQSALSKDCIFGGGYQCYFFNCLKIGPVAGWSYQHLRFRSRHSCVKGCSFSILDPLSYSNRWQGPWGGVDVSVRLWPLLLNAGYEYHWASWHATWKMSQWEDETLCRKNQLKSAEAFGQVFYLDSRWELCNTIYAGIGMKYQNWEVPSGEGKAHHKHKHKHHHEHHDDHHESHDHEFEKVKHASWRSLTFSIDLGVSF